MKKYLPAIILTVPLVLTACGNTDQAEPQSAPETTAVETTSAAPNSPVKIKLGDTINLVQGANGTRDIDVTVNEISISDQCHTGLNGHTDEPEKPGYYVRMIGEMHVKQSPNNFSFSDTSLTALDADDYTLTIAPASACNYETDDLDGHQSFDDPIDEGQKARGALEFWVSGMPEKLVYSEPYEPTSWIWNITEVSTIESHPTKTSTEETQAASDEPYVAECLFGTPGPSLMSDGTTVYTDYCFNKNGGPEYLQQESWANSPDNPALSEYYEEQERLAGIAIADGGTCPAYLCGYGTNDQGQRNPSSGEIQTLHGCQDGYINDPELCGAVAWVDNHQY